MATDPTTGHLLASYGSSDFIHTSVWVWPLAASIAPPYPLCRGRLSALSTPVLLAGLWDWSTSLSGLPILAEEMLSFRSLCTQSAWRDTGRAYSYCLLKPRLLAAPWRGQGTVLELILVVKAGNKSLRGRVDNGNKQWRSWSVQLPSLPAFHFLNEKRVPSGAS